MTKKYSFWWDTSSPDFALQSQLPLSTDVAIVGAGFSGISTAYWLLRLAKKNHRKAPRIVIIDEAPYAAFKSSGRMNGSVYLGSNKPLRQVANAIGENKTKQLVNYSNNNNAMLRYLIERGINCDAEFNGGFRMALTLSELDDLDESANLLRDWGYYPVRFDHNQSQHVLVAPNVKGSLFIPGEGMFDPFVFTNKIARLLRKNGVTIVYGAKVHSSRVSPLSDPQLCLSNGHVITSSRIIHTAPDTVPWDRFQENIVYRREQVIRTEPLSLDLDDMPLPLMPVELSGGLDSVRIHDRAVVMTGGKVGLTRDPELDIVNDSSFNERIFKQLDQSMLSNFPITNHMEVSHAWTYIEIEGRDGLPFIGELPDFPGQYVNAAHGRNKFGLAFAGAKNVAERILRIKVSSPEFGLFAPKRITRGE